MELIDFYSGFEGEDGFLFVEKDSTGKVLSLTRLWLGFFDKIINSIDLNNVPELESLLQIYHMEEGGWYSEDEWECNCQYLFLQQLKSMLKIEQIHDEFVDLLNHLIKLFKSSFSKGNRIYFKLN